MKYTRCKFYPKPIIKPGINLRVNDIVLVRVAGIDQYRFVTEVKSISVYSTCSIDPTDDTVQDWNLEPFSEFKVFGEVTP